MTRSVEPTPSWDDEVCQDPRELLELAAASACLAAQQLLDHAAAQRPDLSQAELAALLHVSPGRVSQVLHGDGVQHLGLLARYLRALGYEVRLDVTPVDGEAPALTRRPRSRRPAAEPVVPAASGHLYKQVFASRTGVYEATAMVPAPLDAVGLTPLGEPRLAATWRVSATGRATFTAVTPTADQGPTADDHPHEQPSPGRASR